MQYFNFYQKENYLAFTRTRNGETKLGELMAAVSVPSKWQQELKEADAQFVIIGIPEDIGVKANHGMGGTDSAWNAFLASFLNIQHNEFLSAASVLLLGYFDFSPLQKRTENKPVEFLRETVAEMDKHVAALIQKVVQVNKIPIIIGGGHNNAYGNIKGAALGLFDQKKMRSAKINVINFDAHADLRAMEGRHSGNGFTYAIKDGYLDKYAILGLQENYLPQTVYSAIQKNKNIRAVFYEDMFIREKLSFEQASTDLLEFTKDRYTGIEIDLDAIENVLSSAATPSGFSVQQARRFIHRAAAQSKLAYLHICEGAARLNNGTTSSTTGKLIAYLVSDLIKGNNV